jgi:Outer membrane protein beta-barrel domain
MNKQILILSASCITFCMLFTVSAAAQSNLGIQVGLNQSNATLTGTCSFPTSHQGNYFVGVSGHTQLSTRWAISNDVQYTKQGFYVYQQTIPENRFGLRMEYVDLSSKIEYNIFKNIDLLAGPYIGYRLTEHLQQGGESWVKSNFPVSNKLDIGLQAGVAARFQRWTAFFRYNHSVRAVGSIETYDPNENGLCTLTFFNRSLQMGVRFGLVNL